MVGFPLTVILLFYIREHMSNKCDRQKSKIIKYTCYICFGGTVSGITTLIRIVLKELELS
jgi:hypothetical protein